MTDLPFFDDDGSMTLAKILELRGKVRTDSIVMAVEDRLLRLRGEGAQSEAEHVVIVIEDMERQVNNGGFSLWFENSPEYIRFTPEYLDKINCPQTADLVRRAIAQLGVEDLENIDAIALKAEGFVEEHLDQEFFTYPNPIEERLLDFIELRQADIRIDPIPPPLQVAPLPATSPGAIDRLRRIIFGN